MQPNSKKSFYSNKTTIKDILVISDDYLCLFTTLIQLKKEEINIKQHSLVSTAINELDNEPFDVIIIKLNSHNQEITDLVKKAKELNIKIVIITSDEHETYEVDLTIQIKEIQTSLIQKLMTL